MGKTFLLGMAAALVAEAVVAALVVASGVVDVSARRARVLDRLLAYASTRSIAHHAIHQRNPVAPGPATLKRGLEHYRAMCIDCHGAPGVDPEEFAAGLHPPAPDLASPPVQSFTDGMLYRTVANGIGSTGMPAFGKSHRPDDIWAIVAFVRHLRALTAEEKRELGRKELGEAPPDAAPSGGEGAHQHASAAGAATQGKPGEHVHRVSITNFEFEPPTLEVHPGDVVEWTNEDFASHTATADDGSFDTGRIDSGETKRIVARKQGELPYFCRFHPSMKGRLLVR